MRSDLDAIPRRPFAMSAPPPAAAQVICPSAKCKAKHAASGMPTPYCYKCAASFPKADIAHFRCRMSKRHRIALVDTAMPGSPVIETLPQSAPAQRQAYGDLFQRRQAVEAEIRQYTEEGFTVPPRPRQQLTLLQIRRRGGCETGSAGGTTRHSAPHIAPGSQGLS